MTRTEVVRRARSATGHGTRYKLGAGGFNPASPVPWSSKGECDCSGFASWCLGVSRQTDIPWYKAQNGGWFETTAIVRDAKSAFGVFAAVPWKDAAPGDLVVYGDANGSQGHVGVVVAVDATGPSRVVHCSKGNGRLGDAIRETGPEIWRGKAIAVVARCAWVNG